MPNSDDAPPRRQVLLLKTASVLSGLLGLSLIVWLLDKAIRFPSIQARQFGRFGDRVPLWIPLILFVLLFVVAATYLFWRAAQRVAAGEDLVAQRHRRRPGSDDADAASSEGKN
jgi:preprotein translocase subunit SecE